MNILRRTSTLPIALSALLLAACAADGGASPTSPPASEPASPAPSIGDGGAASPSLPSGDVPDEMLADVIDLAAEGAGVDPSEVSIVTAESVTWSDGALGCPEPGMGYTQALVPGYRVVVEIEGEELHFHASEDGDFQFCDDPQPPAEGGRG